MITALIFDVDGVLLQGERFSDALARDYDVDKAKEKEFFTTHFQECLVGEKDLKESIAPYLSSFGWKGTVDEFLDYWFSVEHSINEPLITFVQQLRQRGITCVVATNQEKYRTEWMMAKLNFENTFDKVYSSAHLGLKKPAVEFFAKVVDDLGKPKEEVLFWDDDQVNIDGAREYGIHAEFYTDYESFLKTMADTYSLGVA